MYRLYFVSFQVLFSEVEVQDLSGRSDPATGDWGANTDFGLTVLT